MFTISIMNSRVMIRVFLGSLAAAAFIMYLSGNKQFSDVKTNDAATPGRVEKPALSIVAQGSPAMPTAIKPVVERYRASLIADHYELSQVMKKENADATAKAAKYLLCTVSGLNEWARLHQKENTLLYTTQMKGLVQQIGSTMDVKIQARAFRQLDEIVQRMTKKGMLPAPAFVKK